MLYFTYGRRWFHDTVNFPQRRAPAPAPAAAPVAVDPAAVRSGFPVLAAIDALPSSAAGGKGRLPCLRTASASTSASAPSARVAAASLDHLQAQAAHRDHSLSGLEARRGFSSPPQAAPELRIHSLPAGDAVRPIFFDGPGGTQVQGRVVDAMRDALVHKMSNIGYDCAPAGRSNTENRPRGPNKQRAAAHSLCCIGGVVGADAASLGCLDLVSEARQAAADFLHCESREVVYGPSMTALAFDLAAALEAELGEEDEVYLSQSEQDELGCKRPLFCARTAAHQPAWRLQGLGSLLRHPAAGELAVASGARLRWCPR